MGHKKSDNKNITQNKNQNFITNFKLFNKINQKWDIIFTFCINYFNQNNYSKNIINIIKTIHSNKSFCAIIFLLACWFWSGIMLGFVYCFMLIDSLIISLLILQNHCVETNSRRLAKNIILILLTTLNLIGGIMTLILVLFIYMEYSKFFGRLVFKFVKFFIKIIGNIFPPVYLLYPDIKLFNFEDPDMTIIDDNSSKNKFKKQVNLYKASSSNSDSDSNYDSNSDSDSETSTLSKIKKSKKNSNNLKKNNIINNKKLKRKNSSTYPTISTIKYNPFEDKKLNINHKQN